MRAPLGNVLKIGTSGSDTFNFYSSDGWLDSWYGVDYRSMGGNDSVIGTKYDDTFLMSTGRETINGVGGQDLVDYRNSTSNIDVNLERTVQYGGLAEQDRLTSIENVVGSQTTSDTIRGSGVDNVLSGLGGNDKLYGRGGHDRLEGGSGNDELFGDDGNDVLIGGANDDTLVGGYGNDILNAGQGRDIIAGELHGTDIVTGGTDFDTFSFLIGDDTFALTITDFVPVIWTSENQYTEAQSRNLGDYLRLDFLPESGIDTPAESFEAVDAAVVGSDVILTIDTIVGGGTITLKGVGNLIDPTHGFTVWDHVLTPL